MSNADIEQRLRDAQNRTQAAELAAQRPDLAPAQRAELDAAARLARDAQAHAARESDQARRQEVERSAGDAAPSGTSDGERQAREQREAKAREESERREQDKRRQADADEQRRKREAEPVRMPWRYVGPYTAVQTRYFMRDGNGKRVEVRPVDKALEARVRARADEQEKAIARQRVERAERERAKQASDRRMVELRKPGPRTLSQRNYSIEADTLRERDRYLADRIAHSGINHRLAGEGERLQGKLVGEKTIGNDRHSIIEQTGQDGKPERVLVRGTLEGAALGKAVDMTISRDTRLYERAHYMPEHERSRNLKR